MPFPPNQDHRIPLAAAQAMTKRYREGLAKGDETAQMFPREVFEQLLKNPKVRGVRFYYARNEGGRLRPSSATAAPNSDRIHTQSTSEPS